MGSRCRWWRGGEQGKVGNGKDRKVIIAKKEEEHTQLLTPPIKPRLYPAAKSLLALAAAADEPGLSIRPGTSSLDNLFNGVDEAPGAGLDGRRGVNAPLFAQNCFSSFDSSWPVVVQLLRMESRSSVTWRFRSSSFFLSQETLSS